MSKIKRDDYMREAQCNIACEIACDKKHKDRSRAIDKLAKHYLCVAQIIHESARADRMYPERTDAQEAIARLHDDYCLIDADEETRKLIEKRIDKISKR